MLTQRFRVDLQNPGNRVLGRAKGHGVNLGTAFRRRLVGRSAHAAFRLTTVKCTPSLAIGSSSSLRAARTQFDRFEKRFILTLLFVARRSLARSHSSKP